jgi:hypothetical protein
MRELERFASVVGAMLTRDELLVAYDTQLRARVPDRLPAGVEVEHDGPLVRPLVRAEKRRLSRLPGSRRTRGARA